MKCSNVKPRDRLDIIINNVNYCSGHCPFCIKNVTNFKAYGIKDDLADSINTLDEVISKESKFDFDALGRRIEVLNPKHIMIWGGDPMTSFDAFKQLADFLFSIGINRINFCTNGLGFILADRAEYLRKHNIRFTLSHDGLANSHRCDRYDPTEFEHFPMELLGRINCVLSNDNPSPIDNYNALKHLNVPIALSHVKNDADGKYLIQGESLDLFIKEMQYMLTHQSEFPLYSDRWIRVDSEDGVRNGCYKFQNGLSDRPVTIDTLGKDCYCMQYDSTVEVKPMPEKPDYCNNCKFKDRYECNQCCYMGYPSDKCLFLYRFLDEVIDWYNEKRYMKSYNVMQECKEKLCKLHR